MANEFLIVAPAGEGMRREEVLARLATLVPPPGSAVAFGSLDATANDPVDGGEVNVVEIVRNGEGQDSEAAKRNHAEAVAARLGWDVLEPCAEAPADVRLRELARSALDEGKPTRTDSWLSAAFGAPGWLLVLAALLAFAAAGALLLLLGVGEAHFGKWLGIVGGALLVLALWVVGAWRSRRLLSNGARRDATGTR